MKYPHRHFQSIIDYGRFYPNGYILGAYDAKDEDTGQTLRIWMAKRVARIDSEGFAPSGRVRCHRLWLALRPLGSMTVDEARLFFDVGLSEEFAQRLISKCAESIFGLHSTIGKWGKMDTIAKMLDMNFDVFFLCADTDFAVNINTVRCDDPVSGELSGEAVWTASKTSQIKTQILY